MRVMKIGFKLKFKDYLFFNAAHQICSPITQSIYVLTAIYVGLSDRRGHPIADILHSMIWVYVVLWVMSSLLLLLYLLLQKNKTQLTEYSVEPRDGALLSETRFVKSEYVWSGIIKLVERFGYINIYVNPNAAVLIPPRAFASPEERSQFLNIVRVKLAGAGSLKSPTQ
jgi:hypothetical protein